MATSASFWASLRAMKRSYSLIFFFGMLPLRSATTPPTAGGQRHGVYHKNDPVRVDQVNHLNPPIARAPTLHLILTARPARESTRGMIHNLLGLVHCAAMLLHLLDVPFDPAKLVKHMFII